MYVCCMYVDSKQKASFQKALAWRVAGGGCGLRFSLSQPCEYHRSTSKKKTESELIDCLIDDFRFRLRERIFLSHLVLVCLCAVCLCACVSFIIIIIRLGAWALGLGLGFWLALAVHFRNKADNHNHNAQHYCSVGLFFYNKLFD